MTGKELAQKEGKDWSKLSAKEKHRLDGQADLKRLIKKHRLKVGGRIALDLVGDPGIDSGRGNVAMAQVGGYRWD